VPAWENYRALRPMALCGLSVGRGVGSSDGCGGAVRCRTWWRWGRAPEVPRFAPEGGKRPPLWTPPKSADCQSARVQRLQRPEVCLTAFG
jgi:hypothetical protein